MTRPVALWRLYIRQNLIHKPANLIRYRIPAHTEHILVHPRSFCWWLHDLPPAIDRLAREHSGVCGCRRFLVQCNGHLYHQQPVSSSPQRNHSRPRRDVVLGRGVHRRLGRQRGGSNHNFWQREHRRLGDADEQRTEQTMQYAHHVCHHNQLRSTRERMHFHKFRSDYQQRRGFHPRHGRFIHQQRNYHQPGWRGLPG